MQLVDRITDIVKNSAALKAGFGYFFANVVNKASLLLLTLVLARALSIESMGALSVFQVLFLASWTALGLGAGSQVARILTHPEYDEKAKFIGALLVAVSIGHGFLFLVTLALFRTQIVEMEPVYLLLPLCSYANCLYQLGLAWLRQTRRLSVYLLTEIPCVIFAVALSVVPIYVYDADWQARVLAMTLSLASFGLLPLFVMLKTHAINLRITTLHLRRVASLGRRLISYLLIIAMVAYLDRLLLATLSGKTAAGLYSVYFQLSLSVVLVLEAFLKAWTPWIYETLNKGSDDVTELANSFLLFLGLGFLAAIFSIGVWLFFVPWLLNEQYQAYSLMIIPLAFAQWFYCLHHAFSVFLINAGNPEILARNVFYIVACQCAMNIALIPKLGAYGAAIAFAVTCFAMALSTALSARRHSPSASKVIEAMITHPKNWLRAA